MLYIITAQVVTHKDGWKCSRGLPTFILDSDMQGIVSAEHAKEIAHKMLIGIMPEGSEVHLSVYERVS